MCKSCGGTCSKSKISGMKGITNLLMDGVTVGAGYLVAEFLVGRLPGVSNSMGTRVGVKIGAGVAATKIIKGKTGKLIALGMAGNGIVDGARAAIPQLGGGTAGVGYNLSASSAVHSVAGPYPMGASGAIIPD